MKRITFLLTIIFVVATVTLLQAQVTDDIYYDGKPVKKNVKKRYMEFNEISADTAVVSAYELNYMRYCLGRYHKSRQNAYLMSGASLVFSFTAMQFDDAEIRDPLLVFSGIAGISSIVMFITAERWLKRSAIKPSPNGIGVVIEF